MPIFEYDCPEGHRTDQIRSYAMRDNPVTCHCGKPTTRVEISMPHCLPDGMYSYAPNIGTEYAFERRREAMKNGEKLIKKTDLMTPP